MCQHEHLSEQVSPRNTLCVQVHVKKPRNKQNIPMSHSLFCAAVVASQFIDTDTGQGAGVIPRLSLSVYLAFVHTRGCRQREDNNAYNDDDEGGQTTFIGEKHMPKVSSISQVTCHSFSSSQNELQPYAYLFTSSSMQTTDLFGTI